MSIHVLAEGNGVAGCPAIRKGLCLFHFFIESLESEQGFNVLTA